MKNKEYFLFIFVIVLCIISGLVFAGEKVKQVQEPVVAGMFYPGTEKGLSNELDKLFEQVKDTEGLPGTPLVLFVPHAGYKYSGLTAAYGYNRIKSFKFSTIIILGPSHHVLLKKASIGRFESYKTPLGKVPVDLKMVNRLINSNSKYIEYNPSAFTREHSVEIQLPLIQKTFPGVLIVPVVMPVNIKVIDAVAESIEKEVGSRDDVLIIVSTDMSHFHDSKTARTLDHHAIDLIKDLDINGLIKGVQDKECELCGIGPVLTGMKVALGLGYDEVDIIRYSNSGDITGNNSRVVGYFSGVIYKKLENKEEKGFNMDFSEAEKKRLLEIARTTITTYLKEDKIPEFKDGDPNLQQKAGCFVTLTKNGELRGCIGHFEADTPLFKIVSKMAIQASQHDPRFRPVKLNEMDSIELEISVLSPLYKPEDPLGIEKGKQGIYIREKGGYRGGTYLPQVWSEHFPDEDAEFFWKHLCLYKAGLPSDAWKDSENYEVLVYDAMVFSEKELE